MTKLTFKKILSGLLFVWHVAVSYLTPGLFGTVFACLSGQGLGYGYVEGGQKELMALVGITLLFIWLAVFVPTAVCLTKRFREHDLTFLPAVTFALFFAAGFAQTGFDGIFSFFTA